MEQSKALRTTSPQWLKQLPTHEALVAVLAARAVGLPTDLYTIANLLNRNTTNVRTCLCRLQKTGYVQRITQGAPQRYKFRDGTRHVGCYSPTQKAQDYLCTPHTFDYKEPTS